MKFYREGTSADFLNNKHQVIIDIINREAENYVLNVGENQYVEHLKSQFILDFPEIYIDRTYLETYERDVPGTIFPQEFAISDFNKTYKVDIVVYLIPYTGNIELLALRPDQYTLGHEIELNIDRQEQAIILEFLNFYNDPVRMKSNFQNSLKSIFSSYNYLKEEIQAYNNNLDSFIHSSFQTRKQGFLEKNDFLSSLGVPVKKNPDTSQTFAVPKPSLRQKITLKPEVFVKGFSPEPTLDNATYFEILKIINDIGINFERYPSIYAGRGEEDLRDHILLILDPNFVFGSASGETFNKLGKTDILLRYDSSVLFIAECKFWSGEKDYLLTIDQLLSYLTWRDSKTSIIVFVHNKNMSSVLETVTEATRKHQCYIREMQKSDLGWFNFIFSLPGDTNKEISLAVQLFHIPSIKER